MDLNRIRNFNVELKYENGLPTGGIVLNYKPPVPTVLTQSKKSLTGFSVFQDPVKSDSLIKFSLAFQIKGDTDAETNANILKFQEFRNRFNERFRFYDEFGVMFKGYLHSSIELETPIEGDIYYFNLQMLCPCGVDGWKGEYEREL